MKPRALRVGGSILFAVVAGCGSPEVAIAPTAADHIQEVPVTESWAIPSLSGPVHVLRTEGSIPHVYASNRNDAAAVVGFVTARDRFFMMDLARRLALGRLSELLGEPALESDIESRLAGITFLADQIMASLTPELAAYLDAFAAGVNAYVKLVHDGTLPMPSELILAGGFLGAAYPPDLMKPFERRDVAGTVAMVMYQTSFETDDVGRTAGVGQIDNAFVGVKDEELRRAGAIEDIYNDLVPIFHVSSAAGFGSEIGEHAPSSLKNERRATRIPVPAHAPAALLERLAERLERHQKRLLRDKDAGFGSNAWAVAGLASTDGASLLAGDGHLSLAVPSVLYHVGIDTRVFGGGNMHQLGLLIPGMPLMPIGTNGRVAWSQTQLMGDVTDWYAEQLKLDAGGAPSSTLFKGEWKALVEVDEPYVIADVPLFESKGRTESWSRWTTFDGRFIADIEGREVTATEPLAAGETRVALRGRFVVPADMDGDGVVTAVSFDYAGFDAGSVLAAMDALGHANDVAGFKQATQGLVAYSQNFAVGDANGDIFYTSYQSVPCRKYLERNPDGTFADGSDPSLLLDGTRYGGFRIPVKDGVVDESLGQSDPYACVVPLERMPHSITPDRGFVLTANNDPGGMSFDSSLSNDEWYIGGPWTNGVRADTIRRDLEKAVEEGTADVAKMAEVQANIDSRLGELLTPYLTTAIDRARELATGAPTDADARTASLYEADAAALDEVQQRLSAWAADGFKADSGVQTFYHEPDEQDRKNAVATMIFNAWRGPFVSRVFDDEPIPGVWRTGGSHGRIRLLMRMLKGRGPGNAEALASWSADTQESVYFDSLSTDEVESSDELLLLALTDALTFLRSAPEADHGGFGTRDMSQWLWGLRHQVKFESLLADFLGDDPQFSFLTSNLEINTTVLPLMDKLPPGDPRSRLRWFPRAGDEWAVDASNPGFSGTRFTFGSGPVMRMVVSLKGDQVTGQNIIPGGQSGLIDSEYFADQAALWLGNQTYPMRFHPDDVIAGAIGHEVFSP